MKNSIIQKNTSERWVFLDTFRGLVIISMVVYHVCWDLSRIFGVNLPWFGTTFSYIWQQSVCISFILISGYCSSMSRSLLKRGLIVSLCGVIISAVTLLFMPDEPIIFGVLTLIGACMLIMFVLRRPFEKINPYIGAAISVLLFILLKNVSSGYIGFFGLFSLKIPPFFYSGSYFSTFFGFISGPFFSVDYFPLFPWIFMFFTGFFLYRIWNPKKNKPVLTFIKPNPLSFIGRYSLIIYMLHQPIIYGVLLLIFHK